MYYSFFNLIYHLKLLSLLSIVQPCLSRLTSFENDLIIEKQAIVKAQAIASLSNAIYLTELNSSLCNY